MCFSSLVFSLEEHSEILKQLKKNTRIVTVLSEVSYEERREALYLFTMKERRIRGDMMIPKKF